MIQWRIRMDKYNIGLTWRGSVRVQKYTLTKYTFSSFSVRRSRLNNLYRVTTLRAVPVKVWRSERGLKKRKEASLTVPSKHPLRANGPSRIVPTNLAVSSSDARSQCSVQPAINAGNVLGQRRQRPVGVVLGTVRVNRVNRVPASLLMRKHRVRVGNAVLAPVPPGRWFRRGAVLRRPVPGGQVLPDGRLIREADPLCTRVLLHRSDRLTADQAAPLEDRRRRRSHQRRWRLSIDVVVRSFLLVDRGNVELLPRSRLRRRRRRRKRKLTPTEMRGGAFASLRRLLQPDCDRFEQGFRRRGRRQVTTLANRLLRSDDQHRLILALLALHQRRFSRGCARLCRATRVLLTNLVATDPRGWISVGDGDARGTWK